MAITEVKPGQSVTIKVVDASDLRPGMRMLETTYLVYGVLAEIERVWSAGGLRSHFEYRFEGEAPYLGRHKLPEGCAVGVVVEIDDSPEGVDASTDTPDE